MKTKRKNTADKERRIRDAKARRARESKLLDELSSNQGDRP